MLKTLLLQFYNSLKKIGFIETEKGLYKWDRRVVKPSMVTVYWIKKLNCAKVSIFSIVNPDALILTISLIEKWIENKSISGKLDIKFSNITEGKIYFKVFFNSETNEQFNWNQLVPLLSDLTRILESDEWKKKVNSLDEIHSDARKKVCEQLLV